MANELASAYVTIIPSLQGAAKKIQKELGGIDATGAGKKLGSGLTAGLGSAKAGISAFGVAAGNILSSTVAAGWGKVRASMDSAISRVDTIDNFTKVMANMGVSTEDAARSIDILKGDALNGLPTTLDDAVAGVQRLTAKNLDVGKSTEYFLAMNNAIVAGGQSADIQSSAIEQLSQSYSKGRMDMEEWRTLQMAMPAQLNQVAKSMGKTADELGEGLRTGSVSMDDFMDTLVRLNKEGGDGFASLEQQARAATGGIGTQMTNMGTAVTRGLGNVIAALNSGGAVSGALAGITSGIDRAFKAVVPFAEAVGGRASAAMGAFSSALEGAGSPIRAFGAAMAALFDGTPVAALSAKLGELAEAARSGASPLDVLRAAWSSLSSALQGGAAAAIDAVRQKLALLPQPVQDIIAKAGQLAGLVAPIAGFGGAFALVHSKLSVAAPAIAKFGSAISGLPGLLSGLSGAAFRLGGSIAGFLGNLKSVPGILSMITNPVGLVIAGIAALAAGFVYLMATNEGFRGTVMGLVADIGASLMPVVAVLANTVRSFAAAVLPAISAAINAVLPVIGQVITIILQLAATLAPIVSMLVTTIVPVLAEIIAVVVQVASAIITAVMPVIEQILAVVSAVMPIIQTVVTVAMTAIQAVVQTVWPVIQAVIQSVMGVIQGVIKTVTSLIKGDWQGVWNGIKQIAQSVWNGIKAVVSAAIGVVAGVVGNVMGTIRNIWDRAWSGVKTLVSNAWNGIKSAVGEGISGMMSAIGELPGRIMGFFADAGNWLINSGKSIIDGLTRGIREAFDNAKNVVADGLGALRGLFPFSPAKEGPFSGKGWVLYSGMSIMDALAEGAEGRLPRLLGAYTGIAEKAREAMSGAWLPEAAPVYGTPEVTGPGTALRPRAAAAEAVGPAGASDEVIEWLEGNLGPIIAAYAPSTPQRAFDRMARKAVMA